MTNRHLTTMERLAATIAIIFAVAQFLLVVVNASLTTTALPKAALSRQHLLLSHNTNNRNVCDSKVTQSNATIEEEDIDKKSAASLLAVRAFHEALNNLLIVRSALDTINNSSSSPQLFMIGTIVELYRDESYFATPAIITSTSMDDDGNLITMQNTITGSSYTTIETSYIHTYKQYTDGTRASCNVSPPNSNEVYMTPCVVNTSYVREHSGLILYEVSYLNVDDDSLVRETLPFSKVQRRRQPLVSEL